MAIVIHPEMVQGSDEWKAARCGLLTASEMSSVITAKTLKVADNDKCKTHMWELLGQRITKHVEAHYIGDDMIRGHEEEILARQVYNEKFAPVTEVGFVTNDKFTFITDDGEIKNFTLGGSPDGLVGEDGGIECKSRRQKYQIETITTNVVPSDFMIQIQTLMIITEREWWDFISYHGGLPMYPKRVFADEPMQDKIIEASAQFHKKLDEMQAEYEKQIATNKLLIPTERVIAEEIEVGEYN